MHAYAHKDTPCNQHEPESFAAACYYSFGITTPLLLACCASHSPRAPSPSLPPTLPRQWLLPGLRAHPGLEELDLTACDLGDQAAIAIGSVIKVTSRGLQSVCWGGGGETYTQYDRYHS